MVTTNAEYSDAFEDLMSRYKAGTVLGPAFITELTALLDNWMGINVSNAALALKIQAMVTVWRTRESQLRAWLGGTASGGPGSDGKYPLDDDVGNSYLVDCPAKMVSGTQKGDPAKIDAAFSYQGPFGASENLPGLVMVVAGTFVTANCRASCLVAPTASAVFTIKKVRAGVTTTWGTVTFASGVKTGSFVISDPTVIVGDTLYIVAPSAHDATLSDVFITLAGA